MFTNFKTSVDYYKELLQKQTKNSFRGAKIATKNSLDIKHLEKPFEVEEIKEGLQKLKAKKAAGIDGITSDMLKCSNEKLLQQIKELFNFILESSYCPEKWDFGIIHSLHKSGSKTDPSNYR